MVGWMDDEALHRTLTTGRATFWSRSRQEYWVKGETSGHRQRVKEVRLDCDGDTLLVKVDQEGPACHTGARTCFDDDAAAPPCRWLTRPAAASFGPTVLLGLARRARHRRRRPRWADAPRHGAGRAAPSPPTGTESARSPAAGAGGAGLPGGSCWCSAAGPPGVAVLALLARPARSVVVVAVARLRPGRPLEPRCRPGAPAPTAVTRRWPLVRWSPRHGGLRRAAFVVACARRRRGPRWAAGTTRPAPTRRTRPPADHPAELWRALDEGTTRQPDARRPP